jgi:FMN-dependent oxidoreductase (nitrilotriacetate monooxygenase family)
MTNKPFHLGWFMNGSSVQSWDQPWAGSIGRDWSSGAFHVDAARTLERAKFDFVLWEDLYYVPKHWNDSSDIYLEKSISVPRLDTMTLTPFVAAQTSHIGLVATLPTFAFHPYLLARMMSTLDSLSGGRAAWNVVTGTTNQALRNFGLDGLGDSTDRYARAGEFVEVVKQLWDSWEDGSIVADEQTGVFADPSKVHPVKFDGAHYQYDGTALVSGRSPQGRPVIAQAGASPQGRSLAAAHSDVIVGIGRNLAEMKAYRDDVRAKMAALGRNPDDCKVLFMLTPIVGATDEEAQMKKRLIAEQSERRVEEELADMGKRMDLDLSVLPMDEPLTLDHLTGLTTTGHISYLEKFIGTANGRTLREIALDSYQHESWVEFDVCGSPSTVAGQMEEMMQEIGGDGFMITEHSGAQTRRYLTEIADGLVPELQRRGLVRTEYSHTLLRDNLLEF